MLPKVVKQNGAHELLASERSERDTLSRSSMKNAIRIYIYIYFITSILRNIASQLQCISASAAGTSAIRVTDEQYFFVAM